MSCLVECFPRGSGTVLPSRPATGLDRLPRRLALPDEPGALTLMVQAVTRRAQCDEDLRIIRAALRAWCLVVDLQKMRAPATRRLAAIPVARQDLTAHARRYGCLGTLTMLADHGVALEPLRVGVPDLPLTVISRHGHPVTMIVNMDLHRRRRPPGTFGLTRFDQRGQRLEQQFRPVGRRARPACGDARRGRRGAPPAPA